MFSAGLWFLALFAANLLVLASINALLSVAAALLLLCINPGLAAQAALFPGDQELDGWERAALGVSLGLFGAIQVTWAYMLAPGRMQLPVLMGLVDLLSIGMALLAWRRAITAPAPPVAARPRSETIMALVLLGVVLPLLFLNLGYAEYDIDETPVVFNAVSSITGNDLAVFGLRKGPAQVVLTAATVLLGGTVAEWAVRLPFAFAALAASVLLWRLARRQMGRRLALAVLALWLAEGVHVGNARWVQFQTLVLLAGISAIFCFVRAARVTGSARLRFQWLGALFFAFAVFSHYDGAFVAPVLGLLWLNLHRGQWRARQTWVTAASLAMLVAVFAAPHYVAMLSQPGAASYMDRYYLGVRVGRVPYNMLGAFIERMLVLDAPAWLLPAAAGLVLACLAVGARLWRRRRAVGALWFVMLVAAVAAVATPDLMVAGAVNFSVVPFVVLSVLLLWPACGQTARVFAIWALGAIFVPAFAMQVPGDHYFLMFPALTLLAVWGWGHAAAWLARRIPARTVRAAFAGALALSAVTGAVYVYDLLAATWPEYAMRYPEILPRFAVFSGERPALLWATYPHQSGWRAVAALYDRGVLRGEFESNEMRGVSDWYLSIIWRPPQPRPRYYMYVVRPFAPILATDAPPDLAEAYWQIGQITAGGEARMLVYQRRETGAMPLAMQSWAVEDMDADWQSLASLERFVVYRDQGRDDSAFFDIARRLEADGRNGDVVLLDGAIGRPLLSRFYGGNLPLLTSLDDPVASQASRILGIYWASPDRAGELSVVSRGCLSSTRWFKNVRLTVNGAGAYGAALPIDVQFGPVGRLRHVALGERVVRGGIYCVKLEWELLGPTETPHKLFMHLTDSGGRLVAQSDSEPFAGFRPTTQWQAGGLLNDSVGISLPAELPPGRYRILAGLYDGASGMRLPARDTVGQRAPNDAAEIGSITIQ